MYYWTAVSIDLPSGDRTFADKILKDLAEKLPAHEALHPEAYYKRDPVVLLRKHGEHVEDFKSATTETLRNRVAADGHEVEYEELQEQEHWYPANTVVSHGNRYDVMEFHINTQDTDGWNEFTRDDDRLDSTFGEKGNWMIDLLDEQYNWVPELPVWSIENAKTSEQSYSNAKSEEQSLISYFWSSD